MYGIRIMFMSISHYANSGMVLKNEIKENQNGP